MTFLKIKTILLVTLILAGCNSSRNDSSNDVSNPPAALSNSTNTPTSMAVGKITDFQNGFGIKAAEVNMLINGFDLISAEVNEAGYFKFAQVPAGRHYFFINHPGYAPVEKLVQIYYYEQNNIGAFQLQPSASLSLNVYNEQFEPMKDVIIKLYEQQDRYEAAGYIHYAVSDNNGVATFNELGLHTEYELLFQGVSSGNKIFQCAMLNSDEYDSLTPVFYTYTSPMVKCSESHTKTVQMLTDIDGSGSSGNTPNIYFNKDSFDFTFFSSKKLFDGVQPLEVQWANNLVEPLPISLETEISGEGNIMTISFTHDANPQQNFDYRSIELAGSIKFADGTSTPIGRIYPYSYENLEFNSIKIIVQ